MGKIREIENKLVQVPEWSMEFYVHFPVPEEIEATAAHLLANPDIAALDGAVDNAALVLIARTKDGIRHFDDAAISLLAKRSHDVIARVLTECGALYGELATAIANALGKKSTAEGESNVTK